MKELENYSEDLNSELDKLQREIEALTVIWSNQRNRALRKCEATVKSIKTVIEICELEIYISNLDRSSARRDLASLELYQKRFKQLQAELELQKNQGQTIENLFKVSAEVHQDKGQEQFIHECVTYFDQEMLDNIRGYVAKENELANDISIELDKQISKLDIIYDTVKDTQSTLKRSAKYIKDFARWIYTDNLLMCLIGLIFIAIVTLFILSALGYDKFNKVKSSLSTSSSYSKNTTRLLQII